MKLSLLVLSLFAVNMAAAIPTTTVGKNAPHYTYTEDIYSSEPSYSAKFVYGAENLVLKQDVKFPEFQFCSSSIEWGREYAEYNLPYESYQATSREGVYTLSGTGEIQTMFRTYYGMTANEIMWWMGRGTFIIEEGVNMGYYAMVSGPGSLVVKTSKTIADISGFEVLEVQNAKFKTEILHGIGVLRSASEMTTKNLGGVIGGVKLVDGDLTVNGNPYADGLFQGSWHTVTHVEGNANFKSKTPIRAQFGTFVLEDEPGEAEVLAELERMGELCYLTCRSYSGNLSNLTVELEYETQECWDEMMNATMYRPHQHLVSLADYGAFVALYDSSEDFYRIVFRSYANAAKVDMQEVSQSGAFAAGASDLYLKKALTLSSKERASFSWTGEGDAYVMMGKGTVSAGKGLDVQLTDGDFSLHKGCGFKNADYSLESASLSLSGALAANSAELQEGSRLNATGGKVTVKGGLRMSESTLRSDSALTVDSLELGGGSRVELAATKAQSVTLKGKNADNVLTDSSMSIAGKMSVTGNLALNASALNTLSGNAGCGASIHLYDPSGNNKAMPLAVKGTLTLGSGSTLTLSGALSARDMVLDGGTINLTSNKPLTIKVGNQLDINGPVDLNLGFTVADKDVNKKSFKILTFKSSNLGGEEELYDLLGLSDSYCSLSFDKKKTSVMLTVTDKEAWDAYIADEETEAPTATTALVNPVLPDYSGVADALVQANWGLVESSRAFVNTIANRSMAVQLGSGERAVWASAIAGSSRRSSSGTHGGADTNITGGAIGMETQLGENSLLGMALGNSWTRVSAHNYGTIKQDTTHLGLYGQTNWNKLSADWSAAYGRSESKFNGSDWSQRAIQLDGRLSYNHALSETVLLRGFGGVQYYASDSARVDGLDTGEVQNLRGEVGVGIVRSTQKSSVYAELALHQDLVRDNPEVRSPFGQRYHGTNPGRTGINLTIGGSYALSDQWSVNASYTAEVVENANAHSVNVGATYKF